MPGFETISVLGGGHHIITHLSGVGMAVGTLLLLLVAKFVFTMICFCSGAPGGIFFPLLVLGALTGGMSESKALAFEDRGRLVEALKRMAKPGDVMLFKGSHGMHMELALEKFLKDDT